MNVAVKRVRRRHRDAVKKYRTAESAYQDSRRRQISDFDYMAKARRAMAEASYREAGDVLRKEIEAAYGEFDGEAGKIRAELAEALADAGVMQAGEVDAAAVTLLNSGLMRSADFQRMAEDYSENSTMLRLCRDYAEKYRAGLPEEAYTEREAVNAAIQAAVTGGQAELESFDSLCNSANTLSGRRSDGSFDDAGRLTSEPTGLNAWESLTAGFASDGDETEE